MKYLFNLVFLFVVFVSNVHADQIATLTWSPNKEVDLNGYNIYRSGTPIRNYKLIGKVGKDIITYKDLTIPNDWDTVYYKISAFDTSGNESKLSESVMKLLPTLPPLPTLGKVTDLSVKPLNFSSVEVSFTDISTIELGILNYDIRVLAGTSMSWPSAKSAVSGTCKSPFIGLVTTQKRTCIISDLLPETNYVLQLIPFFGVMNQGADYKDFSNVASVVTPIKPKVFTNVVITDNSISFSYKPSDCPKGVSKVTTGYPSDTTRSIIMTCESK